MDDLGKNVSKRLGWAGVVITGLGVVNKIYNNGWSSLQTTDYLDLAVTVGTIALISNPLTAAGIGLTYGLVTLFAEDQINELGSDLVNKITGK